MRIVVFSTVMVMMVAGCSQTPKVGGDVSSSSSGPAAAPAPGATAAPVDMPIASAAPLHFTPSIDGLPETGMWKGDPVFADVNADGHMDLAAIERLGNGAKIWLGNGRGEWTESSSGLVTTQASCGGGVEFADLNGDGHVDLAVADHCNGVFIFLGDGGNHWELVTEGLYPEQLLPRDGHRSMFLGAEDLALGDLNGDGRFDLVVGSSDEAGINVYFGDGTGQQWTWQQGTLPKKGWANRVKTVDINGDGALDILASYSEGPRVWLNDGRGNWRESSDGLPTPMITGLYTGLETGDVNGDGRPDIAAANWVDGPEVYLQQADGSWAKTQDVFPELLGGAYSVTLGRVDGDAHLDMVVAGRLSPRHMGNRRGVFLLCGDGRGGWTHVDDCGLPAEGLMGTMGVTLGDVNGDRVVDVAASSGLMVETDPENRPPALPTHMLVWITTLDESSATVSNVERVQDGQRSKKAPTDSARSSVTTEQDVGERR